MAEGLEQDDLYGPFQVITFYNSVFLCDVEGCSPRFVFHKMTRQDL